MALIHSFKIGGLNFNPFVDWRNSEVVASKDNSGTELNITITSVEFVNAAAQFIRNYVEGGKTGATPGIFEGPKFEMVIQDANGTLTPFSGCLDFDQEYEEISPVRVKVALSTLKEKKSLEQRAKNITMLMLKEEGIITPSDYSIIPYVVEKKFNAVEFIMLSITTFLMAKELAESIRRLADDIAQITTLATSGVTGPASAIVLASLKALLNLAYSILLIIYIIDLIQDIIEFLISPVRDWKGMKFKTMLEKASSYVGLNYLSTVPDLEYLYYLPSKDEPAPLSQVVINAVSGSGVVGVPDDGLPNSGDVGHTFEECLQMHADLFRSKTNQDFAGVNLNQEPLVNDTFWDADALFTLPDTLNESVVYNTDEFIGRILYHFERDNKDDWTDDDNLGRIYEIVTHPIQISDPKCVRTKGFKEVRPGVALGSRKDGLTPVEKAVKVLANVADGVVNFFGGNSNLAGAIENRKGMLRVSSNTTTVPKLLPLVLQQGALKLPSNHKELFSGKSLWEKYGVEDSWVLTVNNVPTRGQKRKIAREPIKVPMGFADYINVITKTRISTLTGQKANVTEIVWKPAFDAAKLNGWFRETYTKNLQHTFYNSDDPNL